MHERWPRFSVFSRRHSSKTPLELRAFLVRRSFVEWPGLATGQQLTASTVDRAGQFGRRFAADRGRVWELFFLRDKRRLHQGLGRPDLLVHQPGDELDRFRRTQQLVDLRGVLRRRHATGGDSGQSAKLPGSTADVRKRLDLYLHQFGARLDEDRLSHEWLASRCFFSGWDASGGFGRRVRGTRWPDLSFVRFRDYLESVQCPDEYLELSGKFSGRHSSRGRGWRPGWIFGHAVGASNSGPHLYVVRFRNHLDQDQRPVERLAVGLLLGGRHAPGGGGLRDADILFHQCRDELDCGDTVHGELGLARGFPGWGQSGRGRTKLDLGLNELRRSVGSKPRTRQPLDCCYLLVQRLGNCRVRPTRLFRRLRPGLYFPGWRTDVDTSGADGVLARARRLG